MSTGKQDGSMWTGKRKTIFDLQLRGFKTRHRPHTNPKKRVIGVYLFQVKTCLRTMSSSNCLVCFFPLHGQRPGKQIINKMAPTLFTVAFFATLAVAGGSPLPSSKGSFRTFHACGATPVAALRSLSWGGEMVCGSQHWPQPSGHRPQLSIMPHLIDNPICAKRLFQVLKRATVTMWGRRVQNPRWYHVF